MLACSAADRHNVAAIAIPVVILPVALLVVVSCVIHCEYSPLVMDMRATFDANYCIHSNISRERPATSSLYFPLYLDI